MLGPDPPASDRRVRLHGAWLRQAGPGPRYVSCNFAGPGHASTAPHGMADDLGRDIWPPGFETDLLYLASLAALILAGSGPLAIDSLLAKRREHMCPSSRAELSAGCRGATGTDQATALGGRRAHGSA